MLLPWEMKGSNELSTGSSSGFQELSTLEQSNWFQCHKVSINQLMINQKYDEMDLKLKQTGYSSY